MRELSSIAGHGARTHAKQLRRTGRSAEADRWDAGAEGELVVGARLDVLAAEGWHILHDQPWPGRPRANIDHIAIGPAGVMVIDAKNWTGSVEVRQELLTQSGWSRFNETQGVQEQAAAVAAVLREPDTPVRAWLAVVSQSPILLRTDDDIDVVSLDFLVPVLRGLPRCCSAARVAELTADLQKPTALPSQRRFAPPDPEYVPRSRTVSIAGRAARRRPARRRRGAATRRPVQSASTSPRPRGSALVRRLRVFAFQLVLFLLMMALTALGIALFLHFAISGVQQIGVSAPAPAASR